MKWNLYVGYLVALGACLTITICSHTALGVRVGKRHPAAGEGEGAGWQPAAARWNGPADGAGSEGKCTGILCRGRNGVTVVVADECIWFNHSLSSAYSPRYVRLILVRAYRSCPLECWVPCEYQRTNIAFHVNSGSSAYWLGLLVEYVNGDGDLGAVDLKQANSNTWQPMQQTWGANWALNSGPLSSPFSIHLTTLSTGKTLIIDNAIPENWQPNAT
eukprot:PITA_05933